MPSERLTCVVRLAGAAPRPVSTFALEKRPSSGRGRFSVSADCGAGIRLGVSRTLVMPALGAGIHDVRATPKSKSWMGGPSPAMTIVYDQHQHSSCPRRASTIY